ncbi:MAG: zinc metallopeptidase [Clostridiales Family XIII bacterium]|jgi:Zn-dependent membrane protease YugP|nr:zinc metallopeptidase [Clostridiales Family XIII bacterium]
MYYDSTVLLLIPAFVFTLIVQFRVKHIYKKYAAEPNRRGCSGAETARQLLDRNGLADVPVEQVSGRLSDHYHPRKRAVRLSEEVYYGRSIAAVSIAAHETGHAIQHSQRYAALVFRNIFAPVASVSSKFSWILLVGGLFLAASNTGYWRFGMWLFDIGIVFYVAVLLFQVITLPVEFNASKRAREQLNLSGIVYEEENAGVKRVLSAAALTYVAAMATALLTLVRLLLIRGRN